MDLDKMIQQELADVTNRKVTVKEEIATIDRQIEAINNLKKKVDSSAEAHKKNGNEDQYGKALEASAKLEAQIHVQLSKRQRLDPNSPTNLKDWAAKKVASGFKATVIASAKGGAAIGALLAPARAAIDSAITANQVASTVILTEEANKKTAVMTF